MKLHKLALSDQPLFSGFLNADAHELSVYSFENIYIWKGLYKIRWAVIKKCLCIFFTDRIGTFLYLPPLGKNVSAEAAAEVFQIMDGLNKNPDISRIENVEPSEIGGYRDLGYVCREKFPEYICRRRDLAGLSGNALKHKRAAVNFFTKHYDFLCREFKLNDRNNCLGLYDAWQEERKARYSDPVYRGLLGDSRKCLVALLADYKHLKINGLVVEVDKKLAGFTFGFALNKKMFCVLYEITDIAAKGLSQFIFREFCRRMKTYSHINIMDDSGLDNLKRVKLSYRPEKTAVSFVVTR